jgi:hypothetical protein
MVKVIVENKRLSKVSRQPERNATSSSPYFYRPFPNCMNKQNILELCSKQIAFLYVKYMLIFVLVQFDI